jgi:hypothetical protein
MDDQSIKSRILGLQWVQQRHDDRYHRDIVILSIGQRMQHYTLHLAKYGGQLVGAIDAKNTELRSRLMIDAFIIILASANTLNLSLGDAVNSFNTKEQTSLLMAGQRFATELGYDFDDDTWLIKEFARYVGSLAKACESLDHLETFPSRDAMCVALVSMFKLALADACLQNLNLEECVAKRLSGIESKHIFHQYHIQ